MRLPPWLVILVLTLPPLLVYNEYAAMRDRQARKAEQAEFARREAVEDKARRKEVRQPDNCTTRQDVSFCHAAWHEETSISAPKTPIGVEAKPAYTIRLESIRLCRIGQIERAIRFRIQTGGSGEVRADYPALVDSAKPPEDILARVRSNDLLMSFGTAMHGWDMQPEEAFDLFELEPAPLDREGLRVGPSYVPVATSRDACLARTETQSED